MCVALGLGVDGRTVRDLFVAEQGDLFTLLPRTTRLDLLDYYDNGQIVNAKNNLGDGTSLLKADERFLEIKMSDTRTVQLLMTTNKKDTVITVIETMKTPVKDSHISFFDAQWKQLDANKFIKTPHLADFMNKNAGNDERQQLLQALPFELISLSLEGDNHTSLVARHGLKEFLVSSEYAPYANALSESIVYDLNGNKWKQRK